MGQWLRAMMARASTGSIALQAKMLGDEMVNSDVNGQAHEASDAEQSAIEGEGAAQGNERDILVTTAATVGVVAVGAALFEVALLPGIALGVAAMLAPKYAPNVSN